MEKALILTALCSGLPLVLSSCAGLLISFLQAATQIQEQSFQFLIKLSVITLLLAYGWNWALRELSLLTQNIFLGIVFLGNL